MNRLLFVLPFAFACPAEPPVEAADPNRPMSSSARFVRAIAPRSRALLEAPARVVGLHPGSVALSAAHGGRVLRFFAAPGDRVEPGSPLAELMIPELAEAAARLGGLGEQVRAIRARITELEGLRSEGLSRTEPLFSLREQVAGLSAELAAARALVAGYGLEGADVARLARTGRLVLKSPVEGVVVSRAEMVGGSVEPGGPPVLVVSRLGPARIEVSLIEPLPEGSKPVFRGQDGVEVPLSREPMASLRDGRSGRLTAWFLPVEEDLLLPDGLPGAVRTSLPSDAVEVPSAAVRREGGRAQVAVLAGEDHRWVTVKVLADSGTSAVIQGPLGPLDKVAADAEGISP